MYLVIIKVISIETDQLAILITAFVSVFLFAIIFLKCRCRDDEK